MYTDYSTAHTYEIASLGIPRRNRDPVYVVSQDLSFTISPAGSELECGGVDSICMARVGGRPFLLTSAQYRQVKFRSRRRPACAFINHCVLALSASQPPTDCGKFFSEVFASFSCLRFLLLPSSLLCVECSDPLTRFDLPKGVFQVRDPGPKMFTTQERVHRENTAVF